MIQRIQSVYFLLAVVFMAALLTIGFPFESRAGASFAWFAPAVMLLTGVVIVLSGIGLAQYRNRAAQAKTALTAFAGALVLGLLQVVAYTFGGDFDGLPPLGFLTILLPFVSAIFLFLARVAIAKDIALVRSMDRLR